MLGEYPICAVCGLPITDQQRTSKVHTRCKAEWQRMRDRARARAANEEWKKPRQCPYCGDEYTPKVRGQVTCGARACQQKQKYAAEKNRKAGNKRGYVLCEEYAMPDPFKPYTDGRNNTWPALSPLIPGIASFDDPVMDPMSAGFPMREFRVPSVAQEVAA